MTTQQLNVHNTDAQFLAALKTHEDGNIDQAAQQYQQIISIEANHIDALHLLGVTYFQKGDPRAAIYWINQALKHKPDFPQALSHRGLALRELGQYVEAIADYEKAIHLLPDFSAAHYNESMCRLVLGQFDIGWEKYETRWNSSCLGLTKLEFPQPLWLGKESLHNKTIFLHGEQGLGDIIQFCRYTKKLAALGAKIILGIPPELKNLLSNLANVDQFAIQGGTIPNFDYYCPLMSLPLAFKTTLPTIPADIPYLTYDPLRYQQWLHKLGTKTKTRIGLVWSGRPAHPHDHQRSIALHQLAPLQSDAAEFFCLHNIVRESDKAAKAVRDDIHFLEDNLTDFADTAALIAHMDLVITVDTAVAHVAGAMGKPVWILLSWDPEWRWLLERGDSPWYPSAKLFRQSQPNQWESVINTVTQEMLLFISSINLD